MSELSTVCRFIIDRFKQSPLVNTITFNKVSDLDINKNNIYPLVNIDIVSSDVLENVITIDYIITIVEKRDLLSVSENDKLLEQDNLIDNLGETHRIASNFINNIRNNNNEFGIDIESVGSIRLKKFEDVNILDGVEFQITMLIENESPC